MLAAEPAPVRTVLSLGDWGYWQKHRLDQFDSLLRRSGIARALITLGNHEEYDRVAQAFDDAPAGHAVRISPYVWILPRPFRFTNGGRSVLSFGGAASVDVRSRREGVDWWPDEMPSEEQAAAAIGGGPAEVMVTHDCVEGSGVAVVENLLASNPLG
ncbi:hypothetical protein [Microbacterium sp. NPDC096154]|uniref:hypothetical protein n=1 Tax=Microbacterium sp. NPDC096154 TaxID=3155549 RepID=UPI00333202D8